MDSPERIWKNAKSAMHISSILRNSIFLRASMIGRDRMATAQAYIEIRRPALDSEMEKSVAMSVSNPIGTNSDMFTMNTQMTRAIRGSHCLGVIESLRVVVNRHSYMSGSVQQRTAQCQGRRTAAETVIQSGPI